MGLYGELLPKTGYTPLPRETKKACDNLRQVMSAVKDMKSNGQQSNGDGMGAQRKMGGVLFAQLRQLNRLSNLYAKETRDKTQEKKLGVDDLHLQLQNLQYEVNHLRKEITNCLEFKSKHDDIELISEEEFYETAPDSISNPGVTRFDDHKLMLARLEWEMKQREQLNSRQLSLEASIKSKQNQTAELEGKLSGLLPSLEQLQTATKPLQEFFDLPMDWEKGQHRLATLLPRPLYVVYVHAVGYSEAQDSLLKVVINGDEEDVKTFVMNKERQNGQEDNEIEMEQNKKRKKRKSVSKSNDEEPLYRKAFPLSVSLVISTADVGSVSLVFNYLPSFNVICCSISSINFHQDLNKSLPIIDKTTFLHNLFDGDSGKTSPNTAVSVQIRKYGGDNFSAVVRQYGFPYKWVQQVCGVNIPSTSDAGNDYINPNDEVPASTLSDVLSAVRFRTKSQFSLLKQLHSLEQLDLPSSDENHGRSELVQWKTISVSEVINSQFESLQIFNTVDRSNRYFTASFKYNQTIQWNAIICITADYPTSTPLMVVQVDPSHPILHESYNIQLKNIEGYVNVYYPSTVPSSANDDILVKQMLKLRSLVDGYITYKTDTFGNIVSPR
jgi:THO complex subunit 5